MIEETEEQSDRGQIEAKLCFHDHKAKFDIKGKRVEIQGVQVEGETFGM